MRTSSGDPDIRVTWFGYRWVRDGEVHDLYVPWGAVHVWKLDDRPGVVSANTR